MRACVCVNIYVQPANAFVRYIFMPEMADTAATGCDYFSGGPHVASPFPGRGPRADNAA